MTAPIVPFAQLISPATQQQWLAAMLTNAAAVQLTTTSWQPGGMARTILTIDSSVQSQQDAIISIIAQGGFLDYAATGSVTYVALNGQTVTQFVTPDPSIPSQNPTGALGWLDALASSKYNCFRILASYATGLLQVVNTTASTYGPFTTGTYHVANPSSSATYSNTASLTISPSPLVGTAIANASNTGPIVITTSSVHGLTGTETVFITGVLGNTAANGFWTITVLSTTTFSLNNSTSNGVWTSGGLVYVSTAVPISADLIGPSSTASTGAISQPVTSLLGVSVSNMASLVGTNYESNVALAARCRLKLQSLSPNGPSGAFQYFALSASTILAAQTPAVTLSSPVTRASVAASPTTGIVTTTVANAGGAVPGISNLGITAATNASPIAITSASAHGLTSGNFVTVSGVLGNTNANSTWVIAVTGASTFTLTGSSGNAAYTGGGVIEGGDLGEVDRVIQSNCVDDSTTALTQSSINQAAAIVAVVTVPQAFVATYTAAVQSALATYLAALPIGGLSGVLSYNDIDGIIFAAGVIGAQPSYVIAISGLTLNGATVDLSYTGTNYTMVLSPAPQITVIGK